MLSIRNKKPWVFWPTRVCPSFFKLAGNQVIAGKYNFRLEFDFTLMGVYGEKSTILSILPIYSSLNYYNEHMSNIDLHTENGIISREIKDTISIGKRNKVVLENKANESINLFIDDKHFAKEEKFSSINDPQIVLGAGNFPWHYENHHYCDIDFHEFKVYHDDVLIAHHDFKEFIYEKAYDLTGNCNFIHKI